MKRWQDFLDSLSTSGGAVLVLMIVCVALLPAMIFVLLRAPLSPAAMLITNTFTSFTGALLLALRGNASKQQMADRAGAGQAGAPKPPETQS
jgi:UPF0716 family protein affecting phage T7 exclusion